MPSLRRISLTFLVTAVFSGILTSAAGSSIIPSALRTSGNQILDASGQVVRLRGVNTGVLNWYPKLDGALDVSNESFDAMHAWGVNAVRIPLGEQYWFQSWGCRYPISPADYQNNVATVVNRITSRGMLAILDLHWNSKVNTGSCSAGQQKMADAPRAITLWQQVAARFKDNPLVAFDLYNEPHDISWGMWRNGGTLFEFSGPWRVAGMQQMYDAVRSTGATNLVFVTGNKWGNTPPPNESLLSGYNIVYATHSYACPTFAALKGECKANPYDTTPANEPAPPGKKLDTWSPLSSIKPVAVTEFGWPDHKDGTYNQRVVAWAESHGANWIGFSWNPSGPFALITDWNLHSPTPSGLPIKAGAALNL